MIQGDEIWLYYQSVPYTHFDFVSPEPRQGKTARAVFRIDGFVSADAETMGAEIVTPVIQFNGDWLQLNVNAAASGQLRVAIETADGTAIPGFTLEEADTIRGNQPSATASWNGKSEVRSLASSPVRLRFAMDYCRLYGFQFKQ